MNEWNFLKSFIIFILLSPNYILADLNSGECFFAGLGETFLPGLGYAASGQVDKAILFGGSKHIALNHYRNAIKDENYQEDPNDIYKITESGKSESGKNETEVYLNRSTWNATYYGTLYQNTLFFNLWDLYEHNCQSNSNSYLQLTAPLQIGHFYDKWEFWLPMVVLAYNYSTFNNDNKVTYNLGDGLTESRLRDDGGRAFYMVGIGEEALFRGIIQKSLYNFFYDSSDPNMSRHYAVWTSAAIFGAAHSGTGFSANPTSAFLAGLYLGYVYQPSTEEFDLTTAMAIHSWWDIIIFYTILNHSEVLESEEAVSVPLMNISFNF